MDASSRDPKTLRDYLEVAWRGKVALLAALVAVPAAALALTLREEPLYQAQAEVLLSRQNVGDKLIGAQDPSAYLQAERFAQTQANVAEAPEVAKRTLARLHLTDRTPTELLDSVSVSAKPNADILVFKVKDPNRQLAAELTTEYARQYRAFQKQLDTTAIARARSEVAKEMDALRIQGDSSSSLYKSLAEKEQQLQTLGALQTATSFLIRPAERTVQVQPEYFKRGLLGLLLGLIVGLGVAFLREALDTRMRSAAAIGDVLGLPLLAHIPAPRRWLARKKRLLMLHDPSGNHAEAFRLLRANLEFANRERNARTIMVTSALRDEGKSTTIANLAVALARGGRRVVLVDLDLRHPSLQHFFDLQGRSGVTQVALGQARLDQGIAPVDLYDESRLRKRRIGWRRKRPASYGLFPGTLEVLGTGPLPPDPGEFVGTDELSRILDQLAERADYVLIDAPSLHSLGDALTLSARVDALFVVSRLAIARQDVVKELKRVLDTCPATKLGYVVTGTDYRYDYRFAQAEDVLAPPEPVGLRKVAS